MGEKDRVAAYRVEVAGDHCAEGRGKKLKLRAVVSNFAVLADGDISGSEGGSTRSLAEVLGTSAADIDRDSACICSCGDEAEFLSCCVSRYRRRRRQRNRIACATNRAIDQALILDLASSRVMVASAGVGNISVLEPAHRKIGGCSILTVFGHTRFKTGLVIIEFVIDEIGLNIGVGHAGIAISAEILIAAEGAAPCPRCYEGLLIIKKGPKALQ